MAVNFSPQIFGLSVGIFRNFRDYFWTVRAEFGTVFGQFELNFQDCF